jgi:F-type H+-transporting ATPase subunit 8
MSLTLAWEHPIILSEEATKLGSKSRTKQSNKLNRMPQLIPFYFLNQLSFSFLTLLILIYVFSKYILPLFTFQQVIRMYITKLSKKA